MVPPGLPSGNGVVQEREFDGVELAATVCVALGVEPLPEGLFTLRVSVLVAGQSWPSSR